MNDLEKRTQRVLTDINRLLEYKDHITFLGFLGPYVNQRSKVHFHCKEHGAEFTRTVGNLRSRGLTGCNECRYTEVRNNSSFKQEDVEVIIEDRLKGTGISFLGWKEGFYKNVNSKLSLSCSLHGEFSTTSVNNFLRLTHICGKCANLQIGNKLKDYKIESKLISEGRFPDGTKFIRGEGVNYKKWKYWCPVCAEDEFCLSGICTGWFSIHQSNIHKGKKSCRCSKKHRWTRVETIYKLKKEIENRGTGYIFQEIIEPYVGVYLGKFSYLCPKHGLRVSGINNFLRGKIGCSECSGRNQKEVYINVVRDGDLPVALKFGIANNSEARLRLQNARNVFQMENLRTYTFPSNVNCREAEKVCLSEMDCHILTERDLKDGYTETTHIKNFDKIEEICERFGGTKLQEKKEIN